MWLYSHWRGGGVGKGGGRGRGLGRGEGEGVGKGGGRGSSTLPNLHLSDFIILQLAAPLIKNEKIKTDHNKIMKECN